MTQHSYLTSIAPMIRLSCLLLLCWWSPLPGQAPTAKADGETLEGEFTTGRPGVAVFRGVPYAQPPVGELRWRPPAPRPAGSGTRSAKLFSPSCIQTDRLTEWERGIARVFGTESKLPAKGPETSEDCLYLNVWTRHLDRHAEPQPVMVWIHGGSNLNGEGSSAWYDGAALAEAGIVVVTINYRLGVFGFMAHQAFSAESPQRASGNYGLMDQLEALRWVQRNISAFGGDPARVTIFGESAGSINVMHLMASPLAARLFHRAIAQSGAPMMPINALARAESAGAVMAAALKVDSINPLAGLRSATGEAVLAAGTRAMLGGGLMGPIVDGWVLPEQTALAFAAGKAARVPLLLGSNALEMTTLRAYLPRIEATPAGFGKWVEQSFGAAAPKVLERFPVASAAEFEPAFLRLTTHFLFTCPTRVAARAMSRSGVPVYLYQFTRVLPGGESLGAFHAAEITYPFGNRLAWLPREQVDDRLSAAMMGYWTRFAATGDPNGGGAPEWPRFTAERHRALELGTEIRAIGGVHDEVCDLIEPPVR